MTVTTAKWDVFELRLSGPAGGNPFLDVDLEAVFSFRSRAVRVPGFYDGEGSYRIRFMPDAEGAWSFVTRSNAPGLDGRTGSFDCGPALANSHGPVRVRDRFHFAYADGTPYFPFGTTCYAWTHQPLDMQRQTIATLGRTRFNKIRMGVFPKSYPYNENEPLQDIYQRKDDGTLDFDRPNPAAFRHFETQIGTLRDMGIEADVIIFHPYDRWNYSGMTREQDFRYLAYLAARLSAYRNVWWSLANEYDFMLDTKPMEQWDRYFQIIEENDPVGHLKSIHNGDPRMNYDHRKAWVSHVCIQNWDVKRTVEWREAYHKPIVNDEPEYEGNLLPAWGNLTAHELVHRFWLTVMRGGYAGHGETYSHPEDLIWWAKGGALYGEAWRRIGYLRDLLESDVQGGLETLGASTAWPWTRVSGAADPVGGVRFIYFGEHQPIEWTTGLPVDNDNYDVDIIDTWRMTTEVAKKIPPRIPSRTRHGSVVQGGKADAAFGVALPGRPYLALRIRKRT